MKRFVILFYSFIIGLSLGTNCIAQKLKTHFQVIKKNRTSAEQKISNDLIQETLTLTGFQYISDQNKQNNQQIVISVNPKQKFDYLLNRTNQKIEFAVKSKETGYWLNRQLIGILFAGSHKNILKPFVNFDPKPKYFAFSYREPHFLSNTLNKNQKQFGSHHLENEWGIWGHNLNKVLHAYHDKSMWAYINGKRNPKQWSFSSPRLFDALCDYIEKNFKKQKKKFMIMPNDNGLVCQDRRSIKLGNTKNDAAPTVHYLIRKLALKYPQHQFFTSDYGCVRSLPKVSLPENCGVIISTMGLPKGIGLNQDQTTKNFEEKIKNWKTKCQQVYLWDYALNFDDYFTPFPKVLAFKKQIKSFKSWGVDGLFVNGSGYQYSFMEDLDTYILSALMIDAELNIENLVSKYCAFAFPNLSSEIAEFYIHSENRQNQRNKSLKIYAGIDQAQKNYLDEDQLIGLKTRIEQELTKSSFTERKKLTKIHAALSFSTLQLALNGLKNPSSVYSIDTDKPLSPELKKCFYDLRKYQQLNIIKTYKESGGSLTQYLKEFDNLVLRKKKNKKNLLKNKNIKAIHQLDEDYQKTKNLTNGRYGFSMDYHRDWLISSLENPIWQIPIDVSKRSHVLKLHFLNQPKFNIKPPQKIEIYLNKRLVKTIEKPQIISQHLNRVTYISSINLLNISDLKVKIFRNLKSKKIACDEIELF